MGFWHTGYMEFHEPSGEGGFRLAEAAPLTYPCPKCGLEFFSERDLRVHAFAGHATPRPTLVFMGRECGRSRLTVTRETSPADWVMRNAQSVRVNGRPSSPGNAAVFLSAQRSNVSDVVLINSDVRQAFQFEFSLADEDDLQGVDAALAHLIEGTELSVRTIDDFIMRSKSYPTASRYLSGLANYLYGVLAREGAAESGLTGGSAGSGYQGKYDRAVGILGAFDRPPAEAICGIVAFHHNQFELAMRKTRSGRVAEVSLRFQGILTSTPWLRGDLSRSPRSSLDFALSDSVIEQVLEWSALPLDGSAGTQVAELVASLQVQRNYDALKLNLVAAEHFLAAGDLRSAVRYADALRHSTPAENWYSDFRKRVQGASAQ
jgi:hypothetical protein